MKRASIGPIETGGTLRPAARACAARSWRRRRRLRDQARARARQGPEQNRVKVGLRWGRWCSAPAPERGGGAGGSAARLPVRVDDHGEQRIRTICCIRDANGSLARCRLARQRPPRHCVRGGGGALPRAPPWGPRSLMFAARALGRSLASPRRVASLTTQCVCGVSCVSIPSSWT